MTSPAPPSEVGGLDRFLRALSRAAVLTAALVIPLYFNPRSVRAFEPDKLGWSEVLALVVALAGVGLAILAGRHGVDRARGFLAHPLGLLAALGAAGALVSAGLSVAPALSLGGSYRRGQGLWAELALLLLFAGAARLGDGGAAALRRFVLLPALPIAAYSLLQRAGVDSVGWNIHGAGPAERAFASLGNPVFLGAYLAILAPLALAAAMEAWRLRSTPDGIRRLAGAALALAACLAGLAAGASRGPVLAAAAGLGLTLLPALLTLRPRLGGGLALAALAAAAALAASLAAGGAPAARLGRSQTLEQRRLVWQAAADLMAASPPSRWLAGYGQEGLAIAIGPHLPERLIQLSPGQYFDRAHSRLWDLLVSRGLLGLLAGLLLPLAGLALALGRLGFGPPGRRAAEGAGGALLAAAASALAGTPALAPVLAIPGVVLGLAGGAAWRAWRGPAARPATEPDAPLRRAARPGQERARDRAEVAHVARLGAGFWPMAGVFGALGAHLLESAVGVPTVAGDLVAWLLLGLIAAQTGLGRPDAGAPGQLSDRLLQGLGLAALLLAPVLAGAGAPLGLSQPALLLVPALYLLALALDPSPEDGGRAPGLWPALVVAPALALTLDALLRRRVGSETLAFGLAMAAALVGAALAAGPRAARTARRAPRPVEAGLALALGVVLAWGAWTLGLRPLVADRYLRVAQEAQMAGQPAAAGEHFAAALRLWPEQPIAQTLAAAYHLERMHAPDLDDDGRLEAFARARQALEAAWLASPDDFVGTRFGELLRARGDVSAGPESARVWWAEADGRFEQVLAGQRFSPAAWQGRATVRERLADAPRAREAYDKAWSLNAGDAVAAAGSLRQALAAGDWDGALERLGRALGPEGVDPATLRAAALDSRGWIDAQPGFDAAAIMVQAASGERAQAMARLDALRARSPEAPLNGQLSAWLDGLGQAP